MQPSAQQIKQQYPGYAGWNDEASIVADYLATGGSGKGNTPYALGGNNKPSPTPTPSPTTYSAPSYSAPQPSGGEPRTAQDLINRGFYGYQGWGDAEAVADFKATGGSGKGGATSGSSFGSGAGLPGSLTDAFGATPSINLPSIYENLFASSGIKDKQNQLTNLEKQYLEQRGKITDNPFLSASMIDQRLQRLQRKYETETLPLRGQIEQEKADIETQLNLQTKQFDINSQQARQSLDYFNTLLSAGALDNASGTDIANITRSTGMSSEMIKSAIDAQKAKNISTSTISYDDGTNQGFVVINDKTGEILNRQVVSASKPVKTTSTAGEREQADKYQTTQNLIGDIQRGTILRELVGHYSVPGGLSVEEIYRLYNTYSPYGQALEDLDEVKEGRFSS